MTIAEVDKTEVLPFLFALTLSTLIASAIEIEERLVVIMSTKVTATVTYLPTDI